LGLLKDLKTLTVELWAKEWDENIDIQALVEQACIDAGLERMLPDIAEWTSVHSDGPTALVISGDQIEYKPTPSSSFWTIQHIRLVVSGITFGS
jgi:hypothetical protein